MKKAAGITPIPLINPALGDLSLMVEVRELRTFCQAVLQKMEQHLPDYVACCALSRRLMNRLLAHQPTTGFISPKALAAAKRSNVNWAKKGEFLQEIFEVLGFPSTVLWFTVGKEVKWALMLTPGLMRKFKKRYQSMVGEQV